MGTNHFAEKMYDLARERYQQFGIDTDQVVEKLVNIPLSVQCWQGDDIGGYFDTETAEKLSLENSVDANTPPMFLYHRFGDTTVPCENSMMYASALRKYGVPFELHIYEKGNHGGSGCLEHPWIAEALRWVDTLV